MAKRLVSNISSDYVAAANKLKPCRSKKTIVVYVESYGDITFWRDVLDEYETPCVHFEVMLPSRTTLGKGKKTAMMNNLGPYMIACVDADYDYLLQEATETSKRINTCPYIFHSYVYAIENYQCYAPSLHDVCVTVTLNDHRIFDFEDYFRQFSEICFPLFVWSVWAYRTGNYAEFSLLDLCQVANTGRFNIQTPQISLDHLRQKVGRKINYLQRTFPDAKQGYLQTKADILKLGVTPQTTYLYIQGHHVFDNMVAPLLSRICSQLRQERETEIYHTSVHRTQMRNELACYENSIRDVKSMLRTNVGYKDCPEYLRLQDDIRAFLEMY